MKNKQQNILIIGAGLCGTLLALRLGQRGYKVSVYEKRPDLRTTEMASGRSINLAFSDRGNKAMKLVGLEEQVKGLCVPMHGRLIHDKNGDTVQSNYSGRKEEHINSISRNDLNALLLNEAEKHAHVNFYFNRTCKSVNFEQTTALFHDEGSQKDFIEDADVIIAADGVGSSLRRSYFLDRDFLFSFSQDYLTHGYKELSILPNENGDYLAKKNALHIWPRKDFMLIALPNLDGSFTVTLFLSYDGGLYNFNNLTTEEKVVEFFKTEFPDALLIMPNLAAEFFKNPTSPLGTIKCSPWHYKGNTLLIGDAAHAIVPFYGQGMNAAFEDVVVLDTILDMNLGSWEATFKAYQKKRKIDTDAIADLAMDNFQEMKEHVIDPIFQQKRKLELLLEKTFPAHYHSKYAMVTFTEDLDYHVAMLRGRAQDRAVLTLLSNGTIKLNPKPTKEDLQKFLEQIKHDTNQILENQRHASLKY
ncbi:FAD-dependent monooxygenase [Tamlana haliotis]|uniref:Kynurenine 3-monooxygenase n=1 Tax=Pseudotamlana haliotis TaxID=2614804 RepID=A0A6N6MI11_9FLAO|nr:NAD(P)/FAD-dependent oxidoreductase [Tamlana haliotis]KAB1067807.1 FAD-dependent monooxygenase [Tamlana haliotis]